MYKKIKRNHKCRICQTTNFVKVLDLGKMSPANSFINRRDLKRPEEKFPLAVYFCKNCSLLQLRDVVHHKILYPRYDYMSSASKPLADYLEQLGRDLALKFVKSKKGLVIDIGGNDGVLLGAIKNKCRVLNVEPAKKIAKIAREHGVETINNFFSTELARSVFKKFGPAQVITANNVFAHIDNLYDFLDGVKLLIGEDGVFSFDVHWVGNLIGDGGFDQIYHEHLCYFSFIALQKLAQISGLKIFDVRLMAMHGALLRVFMSKNRMPQKTVSEFVTKEKNLGLNKLQTYLAFAKRVKKNREDLKALLVDLKKQGKTIAGYGAPAKGNTLFNFCGINRSHIDFIIDTTQFKQGLFTPNGHIPVCHPSEFIKNKPDYTVLLAWNYADLILKKEEEYRKKGGKFIIPVPEVKII